MCSGDTPDFYTPPPAFPKCNFDAVLAGPFSPRWPLLVLFALTHQMACETEIHQLPSIVLQLVMEKLSGANWPSVWQDSPALQIAHWFSGSLRLNPGIRDLSWSFSQSGALITCLKCQWLWLDRCGCAIWLDLGRRMFCLLSNDICFLLIVLLLSRWSSSPYTAHYGLVILKQRVTDSGWPPTDLQASINSCD